MITSVLPKVMLRTQNFRNQLCLGSSFCLRKEGTCPTPGHFLCTSSHDVKMQLIVKYGADVISVQTLNPFCCKGLIFQSLCCLYFLPLSDLFL